MKEKKEMMKKNKKMMNLLKKNNKMKEVGMKIDKLFRLLKRFYFLISVLVLSIY